VLNLGGAANVDEEDDADEHATRAVEDLGQEVLRTHFYFKRELKELDADDLRDQLELRSEATQGTKEDLVERLWGVVQVEEKVEEGGDQSVKMNLHRLKQLLLHLMLRWDGRTLGWKGGASVRTRIVDFIQNDVDLQASYYASCKRRRVVGSAWPAEVAIVAACDRSSFFANFWRFFEVEVRLATVPYRPASARSRTRFFFAGRAPPPRLRPRPRRTRARGARGSAGSGSPWSRRPEQSASGRSARARGRRSGSRSSDIFLLLSD